jgi:hypothetical protein
VSDDEPVLFRWSITITNQAPAPDPLPEDRGLLLLLALHDVQGEVLPFELQRAANRRFYDLLNEKLNEGRQPSRTARGLELAMELQKLGMKKDPACLKAGKWVGLSAKTIERAWDELHNFSSDGKKG